MDKSTTLDFVRAAELVLVGRAVLETLDGVPAWPASDRDDLPRFMLLADVNPTGFVVLLGPYQGSLSCTGAFCPPLLTDAELAEVHRGGPSAVVESLRSFQADVWKAYTAGDVEAFALRADVVPGVEGVALLSSLRPLWAASPSERAN